MTDNVSSNSFLIKVEETSSFGPLQTNETIGYVALEEGIITDGGVEIGQVGSIETGPVWTRVTFPNRFDTIPIVVASSMTTNDLNQSVVRVRNIDITGFDVRIEEYPSQDGEHDLETIGWIAVKPGIWTLDGKTLIANTTDSVDDSFKSVSLQGFSTTPIILSQIQSYNESNRGSHTRQNNPTATGFDVKIEEETDNTHTFETIGYIAIEPTVLRSGAAKISETKYYPYGVVQEGGSEKYLYTGKEMDKGTGLYYYESRYYNSKTGRFVQPDTIIPDVYNPQSLNRFTYVLNNPMRYTDPTGHCAGVCAFAVTVLALYGIYQGGKRILKGHNQVNDPANTPPHGQPLTVEQEIGYLNMYGGVWEVALTVSTSSASPVDSTKNVAKSSTETVFSGNIFEMHMKNMENAIRELHNPLELPGVAGPDVELDYIPMYPGGTQYETSYEERSIDSDYDNNFSPINYGNMIPTASSVSLTPPGPNTGDTRGGNSNPSPPTSTAPAPSPPSTYTPPSWYNSDTN